MTNENKKALIKWSRRLLVLAIAFVLGMMTIRCAGTEFRLPDRSKCTVSWEDRKTCISDKECTRDEVCAHRGAAVGRCTLLDCCDPWRGRGQHVGGDDWCKRKSTEKDAEFKPVSQ